MTPAPPPAVKAAFEAFPAPARAGLLKLRALIFDVARAEGIPLTETLKWGQPAYLAPKGTTLRLGVPKGGGFALFAHCQSTVISDHAARFGPLDKLEGNRAVLFAEASEINPDRHSMLILSALRYHEK